MNTKEIKKIGYGVLKLKPSELWILSARELLDMYEASSEITSEDFDIEMQRTSWFTSLLMNVSGNLKRRVKPDKLYTPLDKQKPKSYEEQKAYVNDERERLKQKFNIK